jgi:hypothetical protein
MLQVMIATISHRLRAGSLGASVVLGVLGLAACGQTSSAPASSASAASQLTAQVSASSCSSPAATARASRAVAHAKQRYALESSGTVIHADLRQIANDRAFVEALRAGNLALALEAANRQLVRHVVRIRVLRGSRVLVDANPTSFDVGGSSITLRAPGGRTLGQLKITLQDIIGFIKLDRRLYHAQTVVRGANGQMRTSLLEAAKVSLPSSGCERVGRRTYVVSSFPETSFTGEALQVWVLTPA